MNAMLAAAGIGAGASALNTIGSLAGSEMAYAQNLAMYNRQQRDMEKWWNKENEYNAPTAQMERLKAAGLNPNLVYGSGNAITPAGSIGVPHAPNYEKPNIDLDVLGKFMEFTLLDKKKEVMDTQASLNRSSAFNRDMQSSNYVDEGYGIRLENQRREDVLPYQGDMARESLQKLKNETRQLSASTDLMIFDLGVKNLVKPEILRSYQLKNNQVSENIAVMKSQEKINEQQLSNLQVIKGNLIRDGLIKNQVITEKMLEVEFQKYGVDKGLVSVFRPLFSQQAQEGPQGQNAW